MSNIVYFDLETQKSASEVGGWARKRDMKMSVGVTYSTATGEYKIFGEPDAPELVNQLLRAERVVGYNILNFDYEVLGAYTTFDLWQIPTLDLMVEIEKVLDHRLPLDSLAKATLNYPKLADGIQALRWFKEGKLIEVAEYCCFDVKITKELHEYGCKHGQLFYMDKFGNKRAVKVSWSL
jgi:DEAD/DEAH box helicase domain-containing protein